jgi:hypothetical protein
MLQYKESNSHKTEEGMVKKEIRKEWIEYKC